MKNQSVVETLAKKKNFNAKDIEDILEMGRLTGNVVGMQTSAENAEVLGQKIKDTANEMLVVAAVLLKEAKGYAKASVEADKQVRALAKKIATS